MESWEKEANLPLPKFIYFPKDSRSFKIDKIGIHYDKKIIPWLDIEMTALTVHHIDGGRHEHTIYNYFMAYCKNGQIINQEIGNISEYSNLLGHFIELYKDKQNKIANL
jgi:hypothetical protein